MQQISVYSNGCRKLLQQQQVSVLVLAKLLKSLRELKESVC
jgi:hypothetical protein